MKLFYTIFFIGVSMLFWQCGTGFQDAPPPLYIDKLPIGDDRMVHFLDKDTAKVVITIDSLSPFFDSISVWDISLQLHADLRRQAREKVLQQYHNALQQEVMDFSAEEKILLADATFRIYSKLKKINPSLFPKDIYFIKAANAIYGKNRFYTRQNCIIIPEIRLKRAINGDLGAFYSTIGHEIFHIISRYNPPLQQALYKRIGFDSISQIIIPDTLRQRILLNPDGADWQYKMQLNDSTNGILLTYSMPFQLNSGEELFFDHFKANMFAIEKNESGQWLIKTDSTGESTLGNTWEKDFYTKIGTNTEYIIHPDEILADNFELILQQFDTIPLPELDSSGKILLKDITQLLRRKK